MPALKGTSIKELGEIHGTRDSKPNKGRAADSDQSFQEKGQLWRKTVWLTWLQPSCLIEIWLFVCFWVPHKWLPAVCQLQAIDFSPSGYSGGSKGGRQPSVPCSSGLQEDAPARPSHSFIPSPNNQISRSPLADPGPGHSLQLTLRQLVTLFLTTGLLSWMRVQVCKWLCFCRPLFHFCIKWK